MEDTYGIILAFSGLLVLISFYAGAFTYKHVRATRNRSLGFLVYSWFSWSISYLCIIVAAVVVSFFPADPYPYWKYIIVASFFFQVIGVFSLILFIDENSQARIGLIKTTLIGVIGSLYIVIPLITSNLQYSDISVFLTENILYWVQLIFGLYYFFLSFLWIIRIWKNSPPSLKKTTTILMVTYLVSSILAVTGYAASSYIKGGIIVLYAFHGGAILSIAIAIRIEPRIINILPFVANHLLVLNRTSGVLLYEYAWVKEERKKLPSFVHGIQRVSQNAFQVGALKSLELDEGILILNYSEKLSYALLTTKSTKYLQLCLKNFIDHFEKEIEKNHVKLDGVINTGDFEFGNLLVRKYFKYIPSRLEN